MFNRPKANGQWPTAKVRVSALNIQPTVGG